MRVFVTGATGFVGSRVVKELINGGHQVLGLARSAASANALAAVGADAHHGALEDIDSLKSGASASDAVIHLGFSHDFSEFLKSCETDKIAIEGIGSVLAGSNKPLIVSSGLAGIAGPAQMATEEDNILPDYPIPRVTEQMALSLIPKGVRVSVVRLSQIHDTTKQGLISFAISTAREKGVSAYVGNGACRWAAAHISDAAILYKLALEKFVSGEKWHAVAEDSIRMRDIAEVVGKRLNVPVKSISAEEAQTHFGWWGGLVGSDLTASSAITKKKLSWNPTGPGLIADLEHLN
jgi:nucleoside-diphosphate-sugar epimerase